MIRRLPALALLLTLLSPSLGIAEGAEPSSSQPRGGRFDKPVSQAELRQAIGRGVDYLVKHQNANGSWGSPAPNMFLDIYSPVPGSHQAYEVASSALALSGLIEVGGDRPGVAAAIRRGADWLLANHRVKRVHPRVLYNTWAHAYALEAFVRLLDREPDEARRARYRAGAVEAVALLDRFQYVDGGWGYYDFSHRTRKPGHGQANSFTTATALAALAMARDAGIEVPDRLVKPALRLIRMSRLPGGAYSYGFGFSFRMPWGVNKPEGSLARTPGCQAALLAWDDPVPIRRVVAALDRLEKLGHFLQIARKYPRPHESWFQNSGYFCFYGYYYATWLLQRVDPKVRAHHQARIAAHLVPLQEEDGSFWDYQLFGYHKAYGTGYVLVALGRCLSAAPTTGP